LGLVEYQKGPLLLVKRIFNTPLREEHRKKCVLKKKRELGRPNWNTGVGGGGLGNNYLRKTNWGKREAPSCQKALTKSELQPAKKAGTPKPGFQGRKRVRRFLSEKGRRRKKKVKTGPIPILKEKKTLPACREAGNHESYLGA